ncbi:acyltransferase [Calothrix sp. 336/3]|nr:acyltransferase [Calothrix sp. 336/3]
MLSFLSGICMGLTVAPINAYFLAWFALAPLWVLVVKSKQTKSLWIPLLWGMGYHGVALSWITGIHPMTWLGVPWLASLAIALFCWAFITLWGAALVTVWAGMLRFFTQGELKFITPYSPFIRILIGTTLWCALEAFWSLGSLWWTSLSYTQSPHNLAILHLGQISGSTTVTAAIVAVNALFAELWIRKEDRKKISLIDYSLPIIALVVFHGVGFWLYSQPLQDTTSKAVKVGIVQGNIPNTIKLSPLGFRRAIAGYTTGYNKLVEEGAQAVLTPEGALPFYLDKIKTSSLYQAIQEKGVVAWVGGFAQQGSSYTNSLFTITGNGEVFSRYDKYKLVPLGEYIPFSEVLGGLINRLSPLEAQQIPGNPNQIFDTPFGRGIVGICYESAFAEIFRRQAAAGGEFILSPSNDAHYSAAMPAQHHAQDIMRAIETDRWAARATNTGYSAFVSPHGKTLWISGHNTYETHLETIYRRQTSTLYVRWGDWLTPVLLVTSGGVLLFRRLAKNNSM